MVAGGKGGGTPTEEVREKLRAQIPWNKDKTNVYDSDTINKMSKSAYNRPQHSESTRLKMSKSHAGVSKGPTSEATKKKQRDAQKGKKRGPASEATKERMRAAWVLRKLSG